MGLCLAACTPHKDPTRLGRLSLEGAVIECCSCTVSHIDGITALDITVVAGSHPDLALLKVDFHIVKLRHSPLTNVDVSPLWQLEFPIQQAHRHPSDAQPCAVLQRTTECSPCRSITTAEEETVALLASVSIPARSDRELHGCCWLGAGP
jgi:hypothetical protein